MKRLRVVLLLTMLLVGCGTRGTTTHGSLESSPPQESPVPTPVESEVTEFVPTPVPTPPADKGAIVGRFVDFETGQPPEDAIPIVLGKLVPMSSGDSAVITMSPSTSPQSIIDEHGYFAFLNVKPGTYAMVFWTPAESYVISDPETEDAILATVNAGEITDLGKMVIDLPGVP